jgi:hypothetical protein
VTEDITAKIILDNKKISKVNLFIHEPDNSSQSDSLTSKELPPKSVKVPK